MSLYITIDENNNITGYGKNGDIEITEYPTIDGQPAHKNLCKWNGEKVILKNQNEIDSDNAVKMLPETDNSMIRIIEDLIDTLIDKNVIALNDLPKEAKDKINNRKTLRNKIK